MEGKDPLPLSAGLCSTWCPPEPQVLSFQAAFKLAVPIMCLCLGLFLPTCSTLHFPLLNCRRFASAHFSSMTSVLWMEVQAYVMYQPLLPFFVTSADLVNLHSAPSSRLLMKLLSRFALSIEPCKCWLPGGL